MIQNEDRGRDGDAVLVHSDTVAMERPENLSDTGSINSGHLGVQDDEDEELLPLVPTSPTLRSISASPMDDYAPPKKEGLGLFEGVFVPCVLSIFSVVLFLRMGFIVGQAGLVMTIAMLVISYGIVFLTILSLSAISTNGIVKGGGAYFMISRSLGPEFGGSIGIVFYFANVFSSALYVAGFVESLTHNVPAMPKGQWWIYAYETGVALICLAVTIGGAKAFAKASMVIFIIVMISVVTVAINFTYAKARYDIPCPMDNEVNVTFPGAIDNIPCAMDGKLAYTQFNSTTFAQNTWPSWSEDYTTDSVQDLQTVFAILFNGCTGIMAGANISGDLADASRAIPYGTIAASGFTFVVYVLLFTMTAASCTSALLLNDYSYMQDINPVPQIVIAGIFSATLSASLSTLIGASRILQAISRDNLLGVWFGVFSKEKSNPTRAVILSWLLVQMVLLIGSINVIAPIVSMLYLISYAITNFACFALAVTGAPNFRPRFHYFTWHTALAGFLGCLVVMYYVNLVYAAAVTILTILFWIMIHIRHVPVNWGDVTQALMYHQVRKYLLRMSTSASGMEKKYWRPQFIYLVDEPRQNFESMRFLNDMKKGGLLILGKVLDGGQTSMGLDSYNNAVDAWVNLSRVCRFKSFVDVATTDTMRGGLRQFLYTSGLGSMRPNIVMFEMFDAASPIDQLAQYRLTLGKPTYWTKPISLREYDSVTTAFDQLAGSARQSPAVSQTEYVAMLADSLEMNKNVGIMRHMEKISDRLQYATHYQEQYYIDIWQFDLGDVATYELLLQLGTILHSAKRFLGVTKLRILTISSESSKNRDRIRLKSIIDAIRVEGEIKCVISPFASAVRKGAFDRQIFVELNSLMKREKNSCMVFTFLPNPPNEPAAAEAYIGDIKALTDGMPPVILMRGKEIVTTHLDDAI